MACGNMNGGKGCYGGSGPGYLTPKDAMNGPERSLFMLLPYI